MLVIVVIFGGIIIMGISGAILAMRCPECKKWFALKWQEAHQRDKCNNTDCDYVTYAEHFVPPKVSYLKMLQRYSPIKEFNPLKKRR
jgi:hypothetical protein